MFNDSGTLAVRKSTVSNNSSTIGNGGGLCNQSGTATVNDCSILSNTAFSDGGGIYSAGTMTVTNTVICGNSADVHGGGIDNRGTLTVAHSIVSDNRAFGYREFDYSRTGIWVRGEGGGVYNDGTLVVWDSAVTGNTADNGAGILNHRAAVVTNSVISGNAARELGGGIWNDGALTIVDSVVVDNVPDQFYHGPTLPAKILPGLAQAFRQEIQRSTQSPTQSANLAIVPCTDSGNPVPGFGFWDDVALATVRSTVANYTPAQVCRNHPGYERPLLGLAGGSCLESLHSALLSDVSAPERADAAIQASRFPTSEAHATDQPSAPGDRTVIGQRLDAAHETILGCESLAIDAVLGELTWLDGFPFHSRALEDRAVDEVFGK